MSATSRITLAVFGRCSHRRKPGTLVAMSLNGPRTSLGASGFGSKVSRWLGPPSSQMRMHDLARGPAGEAVLACKRSKSATLKPKEVSTPRCRKSRRRDMPSHRRAVDEESLVHQWNSMVESELARVEQGPQQILGGSHGISGLRQQRRPCTLLGRARRSRQGAQIQFGDQFGVGGVPGEQASQRASTQLRVDRRRIDEMQ